ncbi:MAG: LamG domain-containing protein [Chromatiales bacterium]|nr:MAG: LamG domain-containing protein [Chromatiales bacterium]
MCRDDFMQKIRALATTLAGAALIAGCGGGAETTSLPQSQLPGGGGTYNGPAPATADVQAYMVELWTNLRAGGTASCGDCHSQSGGQAPQFARDDDVNLAYAETNPLVDLAAPELSRLVIKVAGDHNCWLTSPQACGDIMTTWIENWAGGTGGAGGRQITLQEPEINPPGQTKNFPPPVPAEFGGVHALLEQYCAGCHTNSAAVPQTPFFADADITVAYEAAKPKIDLNSPPDSRLVIRLRDEFHNCWDDCAANAAEMQAAIQAFADSVPLSAVDPNLVISAALRLIDGTVASGGNRYEVNQVALWEFKAGQGSTAFDTSGVSPAMDLTLSGQVDWVGGWGIDIDSGKAQALTSTSRKLHDLITATGEYAVEAWVAPANVVQEDTRIVSYSAGVDQRNLMLGQTLYSYDAYNRSSQSDANGDPRLSTAAADEDLQATLQHVVVNYDPINGREIYVNGVFTDDVDPVPGGTLGDWDDSFAFVLGNEVSGDRQWQGVIRMVAIHNRTLTPEQINQNLEVGVGEKFFLLFYIGDVAGVDLAQSYILFEVSQFDSYSYLFNTPMFISLDSAATTASIPLVGMRIGVNGAEADVGQAYANLDLTLTDPVGQPLSNLGTVIPLQNGPQSDEFFLSFEQLGTEFGPVVVAGPPAPPPLVLAGTQPDIGVRTFDEINAAFSAVTTVPTTDVQATYDLVRQSLPAIAQADTFSSAHEIGIAQLAIAYCDALVEDDTLRPVYFDLFDFDRSPVAAFGDPADPFDLGDQSLVITPLINNMAGGGLLPESQPGFLAIETEVSNLIDILIANGTTTPQRTRDITKAACASVLASGVVLIQ